MHRKLFVLALLCLAFAAPAIAQVQSGIIAGIVRDEQGGVLPGVSVTLSGADRSATFVTEADGRFRFLDLPPGQYKLTSELQGFSRLIREGITVTVGSNVDIPITMRVASLSESLTVTGDSPIVDAKAMGTATNFTQEGEATAHYLAEMLRTRGLAVSRRARGVPLGGELEYVDAATVAQAMRDRRHL